MFGGGWLRGVQPLWSRDGSELFYLERDTNSQVQLMAAAVQADCAAFVIDSRTALLAWPYWTQNEGRTYDVSLDGQQFLAIKDRIDPGQQVRAQFMIIQNWTEELKRLVPTD